MQLYFHEFCTSLKFYLLIHISVFFEQMPDQDYMPQIKNSSEDSNFPALSPLKLKQLCFFFYIYHFLFQPFLLDSLAIQGKWNRKQSNATSRGHGKRRLSTAGGMYAIQYYRIHSLYVIKKSNAISLTLMSYGICLND